MSKIVESCSKVWVLLPLILISWYFALLIAAFQIPPQCGALRGINFNWVSLVDKKLIIAVELEGL